MSILQNRMNEKKDNYYSSSLLLLDIELVVVNVVGIFPALADCVALIGGKQDLIGGKKEEEAASEEGNKLFNF
jgi:hypothetical protein